MQPGRSAEAWGGCQPLRMFELGKVLFCVSGPTQTGTPWYRFLWLNFTRGMSRHIYISDLPPVSNRADDTPATRIA